MKKTIQRSLALAAFLATLGPAAAGDALPAGQFDFGKLTPPTAGGEFVEVNLKENLIGMAARLTEGQEPQVAQLLRGIKAVRVNVIGLDESNRDDIQKKVESVRSQLDGAGWERVVTAQQKDQDVGVYLKLRGETAVEGLVVTVLDGRKQAVFVNIVGDIRPEQIAQLGERFDIEPLKKIGPPKKS